MNQRVAIPSKVAKVMPLMGSPVDGEALNAVRAVGRILKHSGLTYQDLAQAIPTKDINLVYIVHEVDRPPAYQPSRRKIYTFTPNQSANHRQMALWCRDADQGRLSRREREFITNVVSWRRELTIAQADWLTDITDRLEQEGRRAWA